MILKTHCKIRFNFYNGDVARLVMPNNRPVLRKDPLGESIQDYFDQTTKLVEYYTPNADPVARYVGWAKPGSATSDPKWRITRFTYDANDNVTSQDWAEGSNDHSYVWDDRATYTYS